MTETYMMTIPRYIPKKALCVMIQKNDCKKWIIAKETGHDGYEHWQVRVETSNDMFCHQTEVKDGKNKVYVPDGWINRHIPQAHVEKAQDCWNYERKEHNFVSWEDTPDVLKIRYGKLTPLQLCILKIVRDQNDRQIDVFMDKRGNTGKTYLSTWLWERGLCYYVPRGVSGSGKISADCCTNCGQSEYIIIDIQRDKKFPTEFYADIEELKDGLVSDPRYHGLQRNIRGRKLIIFTNKELDTRKLSADRWRLHSCHLHDLEMELHDRKQVRRWIADYNRSTKNAINFQSNSTRNIRQTIIDTDNDTDLYRSTKEVTKCTEDTEEESTDAPTGAPTDAGATIDEVVE